MQRMPAKSLENGLTVDQATEQVHLAVRALLTDEFPDIAKRKGLGLKLKGETGQYLQLTFTTLKNYYKCLWKTWAGVCFCFVKMFIGKVCEWSCANL